MNAAPSVMERLRSMFRPGTKSSRAKADESAITLRQNRDEVQQAVDRLNKLLQEKAR